MLVDLHRVRVEKKQSLRQIEYKTGLKKSHISNIEHGKAIPRINELCKLAKALGVEPVQLFSTLIENEQWAKG